MPILQVAFRQLKIPRRQPHTLRFFILHIIIIGKIDHHCVRIRNRRFPQRLLIFSGSKIDAVIFHQLVCYCPDTPFFSGPIRPVVEAGAEVLITGDIDHHEGLDAVAQGLAIIDAGHYGLEKIFVPYMIEYIEREFPQIAVFAAREGNPFWLV